MKLLNKLLKVELNGRSKLKIILWWELRRILYNIIVLIAGIISIFLLYFFAGLNDINLKAGEDLFEPMAIPVFAILCNMGYTLGWLTEISMKEDVNFAPKFFKKALSISLVLVFLGPTLHLLFGILKVIRAFIN